MSLLGPAAPDLDALRLQLGDAIFSARLQDAKEREALFQQIQEDVRAGGTFTSSLRCRLPAAKVSTLSRWYRRWQLYGFAGLLDSHTVPNREAVRAAPRAAPPRQLGLLDETVAVGEGIRRAGKTRRPKTLVKLPGSKQSVVKTLAALAPPRFGRYHEPFLGSGALFLGLRPAAASLSDHNAEFINAYTAVRDEPAAVLEALGQHRNTPDH
jgi:hypothetical protein